MKRLLLVIGLALIAAPLAQTPQGAQGAQSAQGARSTQAQSGKYTAPRTREGHPDLQGTWTTQTYTPLERPARYANREFLTEQEAAELNKLLTQEGVDPLAAGIFGASDEERRKRVQQTDPTHYDNELWLRTAEP